MVDGRGEIDQKIKASIQSEGSLSLEALTWALKQEVFPSSRKFVLVVLGNFSSETGKSYPSVGTISRATGLTDDTVTASLDELVRDGIIQDTGLRTGNTRRIRVFQLPSGAIPAPVNTPISRGIKYPTNNLAIPEKYPNPPEPPYIQGTGTLTGTISKVRSTFTPPTLEECCVYGKEIELSSDQCEAFIDRFQSNGWKVGNAKAPMKDWKAALRTWKRNSPQFSTANGANGHNVHELRQILDAKNKRMADLKRRHYSDTEGLRGGEYLPKGWRDEKAKAEYFQLSKESKTVEEKIAKQL